MTLGPAAYHGPAGRVALSYAPHTEADPAGILFAILALAGNAIGMGPHVHIVAGRSHRLALQVVLVGDTAHARKSTGLAVAQSLTIRAADPAWKTRIRTTFTSAEAIVAEVAEVVKDNETGDDEGSVDKRLVLSVSEMATQLESALRPGSTIFQTLRLAWDGDPLGAISRRSKLWTDSHHISMIGAITRAELRDKMPAAQAAAGTVNRMLFCQVDRTQELPFGGTMGPDQEDDLVRYLRRAIDDARLVRRIGYDDEVRLWWPTRYHEIVSRNGSDPLAAHFAREDVQLMRLAAVFAALDGLSHISMAHMDAARAIWDHSVETVRWVWGDPTQDRRTRALLDVVCEAVPLGVSRWDAAQTLGRPRSEDLTIWLDALVDAHLVCVHHERRGERGPRSAMLYPYGRCSFPTEHPTVPSDLSSLAEKARQR